MSADTPQRPDPVLGTEVCDALRRQVGKLGLELGSEPVWEQANFRSQTDPYSGHASLVGTWHGGERYGTVTLFSDGSIFAEYQVLKPHPQQPDRYVEAVQVWGHPGALKGDAVLAAWNAE